MRTSNLLCFLALAFHLSSLTGCGGGNEATPDGLSPEKIDKNGMAAELTAMASSLSGLSIGNTSVLSRFKQLRETEFQSGGCAWTRDGASCPCIASGSSIVTSPNDTEISVEFRSCSQQQGEVALDGIVTFFVRGETVTGLRLEELTYSYAECGDYRINGSMTGSSGHDFNVNLQATNGHDLVELKGSLAFDNIQGSASGDLHFTGDITADCSFNHSDLTLCPDTVALCGLTAVDFCSGQDYKNAEALCF